MNADKAPAYCANCHKRIHKQRNGAWYHNHNASVSCRPGEGSERRAMPKASARREEPQSPA